MSEKAFRKGVEDLIQAASRPGKFPGRTQEDIEAEEEKRKKIVALVERLGLVTPDLRQEIYDEIIEEVGGEDNLGRYDLSQERLLEIKNS